MSKTVLITGASRGIGKACALAFAKEGYNCIITAQTNTHALATTHNEIEAFGVRVLSMLVDISDPVSVEALFQKSRAFSDILDVLVNNAGVTSYGLFTDMTLDMWNKLINTNLSSLYHMCHHAVPWMLEARSGSIINLSSIWGQQGASCEVAYSATKGGLDAFTKALGKELAPNGIRVNAISCGVIDTDMNQNLNEIEKEQLTEEIPLGRFGTTDEIAQTVLFLASQSSSYITASIIPVNGGIY